MSYMFSTAEIRILEERQVRGRENAAAMAEACRETWGHYGEGAVCAAIEGTLERWGKELREGSMSSEIEQLEADYWAGLALLDTLTADPAQYKVRLDLAERAAATMYFG